MKLLVIILCFISQSAFASDKKSVSKSTFDDKTEVYEIACIEDYPEEPESDDFDFCHEASKLVKDNGKAKLYLIRACEVKKHKWACKDLADDSKKKGNKEAFSKYNIMLGEISRTELKREYQKKCEAGKEDACAQASGFAQSNERKELLPSMKKGCDNGAIDACEQAGKSLANDKKSTEAIPYLQKACDKTYFNSCFTLGSIHYSNENFEEALKLYKKSCEGNRSGCATAGLLMRQLGNRDQGNKYLDRWCSKGVQDACKYKE